MAEANLLITYNPLHKEYAEAEIKAIGSEAGKTIEIKDIEEGLAQVSIENSREFVRSLSDIDKTKFKYTFYWWPVDEWCKSTIEEMQKCIKKLQEGIKPDESWKMDLAKRKAKEYPKDIILKLTEVIDKKKVDLKNPSKIIKVEIISDKAAISLLTKNEIFNARPQA